MQSEVGAEGGEDGLPFVQLDAVGHEVEDGAVVLRLERAHDGQRGGVGSAAEFRVPDVEDAGGLRDGGGVRADGGRGLGDAHSERDFPGKHTRAK